MDEDDGAKRISEWHVMSEAEIQHERDHVGLAGIEAARGRRCSAAGWALFRRADGVREHRTVYRFLGEEIGKAREVA